MKSWVETDENGEAIRIFRSRTAAYQYVSGRQTYASEALWIQEMDRRKAIGQIREWVYKIQNGLCYYCGNYITKKAHLHERQSRGMGGEISRINSVMSCADCHLKDQHGDRAPRFSTPTQRNIG